MELYYASPQDQQPPPGLDPEAEYFGTMLAIAQDIGRECGLPNLEFYVSTALRQGNARTRAGAARDALDVMPLHDQSAAYREQIALEDALGRVLAEVAGNGYVHFMGYTEGLKYEGKTFAHYCPPYGPLWALLEFLDRLPAGRGYARGDTMKGQRAWLHIDPGKLADRTRRRGARGTSKRAIQGCRPYAERRLGLIEGQSGAHNRKEYRPTWWGADAQTAAAIFQEALRRLVEDDRAGRLPRGLSGSRNPRAALGASQAPESEAVRNWCETGAKLELAQPDVKTGCCDDFRADTDTDYIRDCSLGVSTTQTVITTEGGLVRGSGSNRAGSGSRLPPAASLPAYVGALVSVLGEGQRSRVETTARGMIEVYGDEAVAPFFEEAARVKWAGILEALTWLRAQVSAAVARGDIPKAGILGPIPPAAAALKNRARG